MTCQTHVQLPSNNCSGKLKKKIRKMDSSEAIVLAREGSRKLSAIEFWDTAGAVIFRQSDRLPALRTRGVPPPHWIRKYIDRIINRYLYKHRNLVLQLLQPKEECLLPTFVEKMSVFNAWTWNEYAKLP